MALLLALAACGSPQEKATKAAARFDIFYAQRAYLAARLEINKAIAAQDDVPEYYAKLARVQLALGNYLPAFDAYERVIELEPKNKEAIEAMAELSYAGGSLDDSEKFADQILAGQPRSLRMLLVKGSIAAARHEAVETKEIADNMLAIDPGNEGAAILLARALLMSGDREGAIGTLERSIANDGESQPKLMALMDLYAGANNFQRTARIFARLFTLRPDDVDLRLEYVRLLYEQERPDRALGMLARLTRAHRGDNALEQQIVDIWTELGSARVDVDRVRRFVDAGGDQTMKVALGHLLLDQERYADAETVLRPFIDKGDITVGNVEADVRYAGALSGLGRRAEAMALIDKVLAFDDNHPRALLMRVNISVAKGDLDQAQRDAQLLVRDNPAMVEGRVALGQVYVRRKEPILADNAYGRAMKEVSQDSAMLAAYIEYQLGKGRQAMARDAAKRFTAENPRSREGWRERASLCIDLGEADCVQESFNALDQLPGGPKMLRALDARWKLRGGTARKAEAAAG